MTKIDQKWSKSPKICFQWAHMIKIVLNYVWKTFQNVLSFFDNFWVIFFFSLKTHDFSKKIFENSKKSLFDLWDLLWWVFHMFLALNHWFRPKKWGVKKSVPKMFKTAVTLVLKRYRNCFQMNPINGVIIRVKRVTRQIVSHVHLFLGCRIQKPILYRSILTVALNPS